MAVTRSFQEYDSLLPGSPVAYAWNANPDSETTTGAPTGYWDDPVNIVKPGQAELLFIAYFDWDQMDYIDLRYYRAKIGSFDTHSELVGREALIERQHAAIHLMDE